MREVGTQGRSILRFFMTQIVGLHWLGQCVKRLHTSPSAGGACIILLPRGPIGMTAACLGSFL